MKLERMDAFFNARVEGYDDHMLQNVDGASCFTRRPHGFFRRRDACRCSTWASAPLGAPKALWERNPLIHVTGVDLSAGCSKSSGKNIPNGKSS